MKAFRINDLKKDLSIFTPPSFDKTLILIGEFSSNNPTPSIFFPDLLKMTHKSPVFAVGLIFKILLENIQGCPLISDLSPAAVSLTAWLLYF